MKNKLKSIYSIFLIIALFFPFMKKNHSILNSVNDSDFINKFSNKNIKEISINNNVISKLKSDYKNQKLNINIKKNDNEKNNFYVNNTEFLLTGYVLISCLIIIWMFFNKLLNN
jgi:ATP-dependent Zn protease